MVITMNMRFMLVAATVSVAMLGVSFSSLAAPPEHASDHNEFSTEDRAALTDAHITALKTGLKLTPAQENNWSALEAVLRDVAKARAARMVEWHQKAKEGHEHPNLIEGLQVKAKALTTRAEEMSKIADAAKPLYDSLDEGQKRRFGILFHTMARMHHHMDYMEHMGWHPDGHEDAGHGE